MRKSGSHGGFHLPPQGEIVLVGMYVFCTRLEHNMRVVIPNMEGIVPGGEVAENAINMDQRIGVEIIQRALRAPISCIAKNVGEEGAVIIGELVKEGVAVEL